MTISTLYYSPCVAALCSRKTLIYLILTLNHIYPDYDFSRLRADDFKKEQGVGGVEELVDTHMVEVSKVRSWHAFVTRQQNGTAASTRHLEAASAWSKTPGWPAACCRGGWPLRGGRLTIAYGAAAACAHAQVWENTPGFGDKPFLDTLWTSIDEVRSNRTQTASC
jgi:hypothetical protein